MGMDVDVYRLIQPCSLEEAEHGYNNKVRISLTQVQLEKLRTTWPDLLAVQVEYFNAEKLAKDHNIPEGFYLNTWDMSAVKGWAAYSDVNEKLPDILIEANTADYNTVDDEYHVGFEVERLGNLRKPFRGANTSVTSVEDGVVLAVQNFDNTVSGRLTALLGDNAMGQAYALLMYEDLPRLEALKGLCEFPELWQSQVLDCMAPGCVTVINW